MPHRRETPERPPRSEPGWRTLALLLLWCLALAALLLLLGAHPQSPATLPRPGP